MSQPACYFAPGEIVSFYQFRNIIKYDHESEQSVSQRHFRKLQEQWDIPCWASKVIL